MEHELFNQLKNLAEDFNLDYLVLFGSRANGNYKVSSDYDLAFYKKNISIDEEILMRDILDSIFTKVNYDLLNLEKDHTYYLLNQIYRYGKIIYLANKKLFQIEKEKSYFNYIDSKQDLLPLKMAYLS